MREEINSEFKNAMKSKDQLRLSTLRLMKAAIAEQDIDARGGEDSGICSDDTIMELLARMIKQREESARQYESGGRVEMCERERAEIDIIREFLPTPLTEDEVNKAIRDAIDATGASSLKDMGAVMGTLREKYLGRMDFGTVGKLVKESLANG